MIIGMIKVHPTNNRMRRGVDDGENDQPAPDVVTELPPACAEGVSIRLSQTPVMATARRRR
jgi:hypothetical protein